jgi:hypothetical protein
MSRIHVIVAFLAALSSIHVTRANTVYPAQVLNLTSWKLQLPINSTSGLTGSAYEVLQPTLATYSNPSYFFVSDGSTVVEFVAPTRGATTSRSTNPRTELREMASNGRTTTSWSTSDGSVNTLQLTQTVWKVPSVYKTCAIAQVFSLTASSPWVEIQYRSGNLVAQVFNTTAGTSKRYTLVSGLVLGSKFTQAITITNRNAYFYVNATLKLALSDSAVPAASMYFKAGAYGQYAPLEAADDSSRVWIHELRVTHSTNKTDSSSTRRRRRFLRSTSNNSA